VARGVLATLLLTACNLEEISIPLGQEVLVVQGVMTLDPAVEAQYIVVERSLTGTIDAPDQDSLRAPPRPPLPVSGANVVVTRDDGNAMVFAEGAIAGVYEFSGPASLGFLAAGREYFLRVTVPDGRVVTGRMRMPDFPSVQGLPADLAEFNRDRDTMRLSWSGGGSTKGVFVQVRPRDILRRLTLFFFTDSTRFRVAGSQPLPFVSDTLPPMVFVPGTRMTFTVAAIDSTLFDFTRSGNEPFTGAGFINTIEGALGVFGGVAPVNREWRVVADVDHPWEGRYLLELVDGDTVTQRADVRLFVTEEQDERTLVAGLLENGVGAQMQRAEVSGRVENGELRVTLLQDAATQRVQQFRLLLRGVFQPDGVTTGQAHEPGNIYFSDFRLTRLP